MSGLSVKITAEEAELFGKLNTLQGKIGETQAQFKQVSEEAAVSANATKEVVAQVEATARAQAKLAREQEQFAQGGKRFADQLLRSNETLEESFERQREQLKAALDAGKLGAQDYEKAITVLQARQEDMRQKEARAALESSEAWREQQAQISAGVNTVERLNRTNETLEDTYRRMKAEVTAAHQAGKIGAQDHEKALNDLDSEYNELVNQQDKSVGEGFLAKIGPAVAGWVSIGAAVAAVTEGVRLQNEEIQKGLDLIKQSDPGNRDLATVSATQEELVQRIQQSENLQSTEGMTADVANALVFALDSQGFIGQDQSITDNDQMVSLFGRLSRIADPTVMAQVSGQMRQSFGVDVSEGINMTLAAAESSPFTAQQLAGQIAAASSGTGMFRTDDRDQVAVETAAMTAALSLSQGTRSGDLLKSAMIKFAGQFPDATPMEASRMALSMSAEERRSAFGEDQSVRILLSELENNPQLFADRVESVSSAFTGTGTDQDLMESRIALRESADPNSVLIRQANRNRQQREIAAARSSETAARLGNEALRNTRQRMITEGRGTFSFLPDSIERFIDARTDFDDWFGVDRMGAGAKQDTQNQIRAEIDAQRRAEQEAAAERRNKELKDALQSRPPLVTRPGDDS